MLNLANDRQEIPFLLPGPQFPYLCEPASKKKNICSSCSLSFGKKRDLELHLSLAKKLCHRKSQFPKQKNQLPLRNIFEDDRSSQSLIKCKHCCLTFDNEKGLNQHVGKVHLNKNKRSRCPHCYKRFKHKYALKFHIRQVHDRSTRVSCERCGKSMYNKYTLNDHLRCCKV
ncbi:unnamed protein product [Blepharisma stoltei]|uniref:C2H2-type domain-containing protein n=1 Tax=Blepharisma stoltei TaxID=1481888 RepID=A0AAU9ISP8_9CILI|nr:unnamed protein product [Blepharisma stoltei]